MSPSVSDRNLLYGILAVQMDFATQSQLIAGMNAWVLDKAKPLGEHLLAQRALTPQTHELLAALVDKHIEQHGGNVERSLAAATSAANVSDELARIADADVQTSLARVAETAPHAARRPVPQPPNDRHATVVAPAKRSDERTRFEVLRPHASGGLGKVSVARDLELNREVALKELLDAHADDANSRARFLQEAEITGGLEHPGVVPIYGLGQYSDGRPFYAMRFIRGDSLREGIERFHRQADPKWNEASTQIQLRRLLARMIDVCNAIGYAHSRGVLHRDLKPGNVMLGQYGETLVVDWGLAKAMGKSAVTQVEPRQSPANATVRVTPEPLLTPSGSGGSAPTQMGAAIGTPAFMSPEQAAGRIDQLGPASDIYSLGATLYFLLTDLPPQQDNDLGIVLQRVQRGDFPPPRAVKPVVSRSLEAICLKAMALEPADRYLSARALADDLEAWLADEPVKAMPEPWTAHARRWIKKHRALVSSGAGVAFATLVASLLGVAVLTAANQRERDAKEAAQVAERNAKQQESAALAAKAEADRQSERNAELLELARKSLENYDRLSKSEELQRYGLEKLRGGLQEAALTFYETLARQAGESEQARADRGDALHRIGSTYWQLGRVSESVAAFRQARDIFESLERDFPDTLRYRRAAAVMNAAIGEHLANTQQSVAAAEPLAESRKRLQSILDAQPRNTDAAAILAYGWGLEGERLRQTGAMEAASERFSRGIALLNTMLELPLENDVRRDLKLRLARLLNKRAAIQSEGLWRFEPASADYKLAREIFAEQYAAQPNDTDLGYSLAFTIRRQGELAVRGVRFGEARQSYIEAIELLTKIEQQVPDVPHYRQEMAELLMALAALPDDESVGKLSIPPLERIASAVSIMLRLSEQAPERPDYKLALARYRSVYGNALLQRGRLNEAQTQFDAAIALLAELSRHAAANIDNAMNTAQVMHGIAEQLAAANRPDDSLELLDQAYEQFQRVRELAPAFSQAALSIAEIHTERAEIYGQRRQWIEAIQQLDAVAVISDELKDKSDAALLQAGFRLLVMGAAAAREIQISTIRDGGLMQLADSGEFDLLYDQATRWGEFGGKPSDHFVAAQALAYGAGAAAARQDLSADERKAVADRMAAAAVSELAAADEAGYIRRTSGFTGIFSTRPSLDDLKDNEIWAALQDRQDFQQLLQEISQVRPSAKDDKASDQVNE